jgi:HEPN domain-containing protein
LPRKTDAANPADWILIAEADLEAIENLIRQELGYAMCRSKLAEVLEKTLKAELIRLGWPLEKTHDLGKLGQELQARGSDLAAQVRPLCMAFAQAYFVSRYPGFDLEDADWPDLRQRLSEDTTLLGTVKSRLAVK